MFHTAKVEPMMDTELTVQALFLCAGSFLNQVIQLQHYQVSQHQSAKQNYKMEMHFYVLELTLFFSLDGVIVLAHITLVCNNPTQQQEQSKELFLIHFGTMFHVITQLNIMESAD
jgi:hypothetical protein